MAFPNSQATFTLQKLLDKVRPLGDVLPVLVNVGGYQLEPFVTICTDVYRDIVGVPFPHKWNEIKLPHFYTNSFQQDYVVLNPDGSSFYNVEWLTRGIVVELSSTSLPKPFGLVECGRQIGQQTGSWQQIAGWNNPTFVAVSFPNYMLVYGRWGAGDMSSPTVGNNPGPGSIYTNPLGVSVTSATWVPTGGGEIIFWLNYIPSGMVVGGELVISAAFPVAFNNSYVITAISGLSVTVSSVTNPGVWGAGGVAGISAFVPAILGQGANPITQILDPNENIQVVTTYGTCGNTQPLWPASNAPPGTRTQDGTVVWTVADPNGIGVRIDPVPSQTGVVFQFNLIGQMPAIQFTKLNQTIAPFPDKYEGYFRQGIIAQCYRYATDPKIQAKFEKNYQIWIKSLNDLRSTQDRELEENRFVVEQTVFSRGGSQGGNWYGAAWPFNNPR